MAKKNSFKQKIKEAEIALVRDALKRNDGNLTRTAADLEMIYNTLQKKIVTLGLDGFARLLRAKAVEKEEKKIRI